MYETSRGNGLLVRDFLGAARPFTSSLMYEVSRRQPVVSDFRPLIARGIPGMSFGMLDGPAYDHTAYDSRRVVPRGRPAARGGHGARAGPPPRRRRPVAGPRPDVVYFDARRRRLGGVRAVAGHAVRGPGRGAVRRRRRRRGAAPPARRCEAPPGRRSAPVPPSPPRCWSSPSSGRCTAAPTRQRVWTQTGVVISDWYRVGLVLLAAAVVLTIYGLLLRRLRAWDLAVVALAWWAAGAVGGEHRLPGCELPAHLVARRRLALGAGRRRRSADGGRRRTGGRRRRSSPSPAPCPASCC